MELQSLPDGPLVLIYSLLDPRTDLPRLAEVNRGFCKQANSDEVWKAICSREWRSKNAPPTCTLKSHLEALSEQDLKAILGEYVEENGNLVNQALALKLLSSLPGGSYCSSKVWAQNMEDWKATYFFAENDGIRLDITIEELCGRYWMWEFHPHMLQEISAGLQMDGLFRTDGSYVSSFHEDQRMTWRHVDTDCVQVADHPPLQVSRTQDWEWLMHNQFGFFTSISKGKYDMLVQRELPSFWPASSDDDDDDLDDEEFVEALSDDDSENEMAVDSEEIPEVWYDTISNMEISD